VSFKKLFPLKNFYINNSDKSLKKQKNVFKKNTFLLMSRNRETPLPMWIKGGKNEEAFISHWIGFVTNNI
jgi:hypothetical protein